MDRTTRSRLFWCRYRFCNMVLFGGRMTSDGMTSCRDWQRANWRAQNEKRRRLSAAKNFLAWKLLFFYLCGGWKKSEAREKKKKAKNQWVDCEPSLTFAYSLLRGVPSDGAVIMLPWSLSFFVVVVCGALKLEEQEMCWCFGLLDLRFFLAVVQKAAGQGSRNKPRFPLVTTTTNDASTKCSQGSDCRLHRSLFHCSGWIS